MRGELNTNTKEPPKALEPQGARLVTPLHKLGRTLLTNADVEAIIGLGPKSARNFAAALNRLGVATRLKPGLSIPSCPTSSDVIVTTSCT